MKLVFVDLDGVMIPLKEESFKSFVFNPIAVAMLNCLTGETGAHIVVSSRKCMDLTLDQVQEVFSANCVHGKRDWSDITSDGRSAERILVIGRAEGTGNSEMVGNGYAGSESRLVRDSGR